MILRAKDQASKKSACLKRVIKNFKWCDSFRNIYPREKIFSRYYEHIQFGKGATRIDRSYHFGSLEVIEAKYVGVAFSDHFALILTLKVPELYSKLSSPRSKPFFKARPEVVTDKVFKERLKLEMAKWSTIRTAGLNILPWWELIVKPGIKKLLFLREK